MHVGIPAGGRGSFWIAAAALILILASLVGNTVATYHNQRRLVEHHLELAGQAMLGSLESQLMRSFRLMRGGMRDPDAMRARIEEVLADAASGEDVAFLALLDETGEVAAQAWRDDARAFPDRPYAGDVVADLLATGEHERLHGSGEARVFIAAGTARPVFARMGRGHMGMGMGRMMHSEEFGPSYLVVGLTPDRYFALSSQFGRTAAIQAGFAFIAAALLLYLFTVYLKRREQQARLAGLERFQSELLDTMPDGLVSLDDNGVVRAANPAAHAILDREEGSLVGDDGARLGLDVEHGSWIGLERDGKRLELLARDTGAGRIVLIRDRTAMADLETRLADAERLAAIGRLAAGVAHEIRNPLSALRGLAQHFAKKFGKQDPAHEYATTMVREADRLNTVVSDLLHLARPRPLTMRRVDLAEIGRQAASLMAMDAADKDCALEVAMSGETFADSDALMQSIINLVVNALAVCEPGGRILLSGETANGMTRVSVADEGPGMDEETRRRAAEPFFTTRPDGTGLGLAIVASIVRDHGGELRIESAPGEGARVTLEFPNRPEQPGAEQS